MRIMICIVSFLCIIIHFAKFTYQNIIDVDLCQYETFHPVCQSGEIIIIDSATYGRMKIGKCVELDEKFADDPSWIGCYVDVTEVIRRKCSAKSECSVPIKDKDLGITERPCFKGLLTYLSVRYKCLPVLFQTDRCNILAKQDKTSFLISLTTTHHSPNYCGSNDNPWILEAGTGQKITINTQLIVPQFRLESFEKCPTRSNIDSGIKAGYMIDQFQGQTREQMCYYKNLEISYRYESKGSKVELVLTKLNSGGDNNTFLMMDMIASGCLDLIPAEDAWLKRNGDTATIGCYSSRQTWQLKCIGSQWMGVVGNCSMGKVHAPNFNDNNIQPENNDGNGQILTLIIICGCGLLSCSMIICCGVFCVKRISNGQKKSLAYLQSYQENNFKPPTQLNSINPTLTKNPGFSSQHYNDLKGQYQFNTNQESSYFVLDQNNEDKSSNN